jgi:ABC-type multidrug transport system ATPase subunit
MTATDHLLFYGALRGLTAAASSAAAHALITQLGIERHRNLPAGGYSGGTKRKLSVAVSLVGDPAVVLLAGAYTRQLFSST